MAYLLENAQIREQFGKNGRRRVDPDFRKEKMVADISEVYQMMLERKSNKIARFDAALRES